jgi:hypothetical protein
MSDFQFTPAMFRVQAGDIITSKKGFLFKSDMTGLFYRVTKFRVIGFCKDGSVTVEKMKYEEVDATPVGNDEV